MKMLTKKNLILLGFFSLMALILGGYGVSVSRQNSPRISTELSPRAKEFIADQRRTGTSQWNLSNVDEVPTTVTTSNEAGMVITTRCFSLQSPFQLQHIVQQDTGSECTFEAKTSSPVSRLVLHRYAAKSLEDDASYALRKRMKLEYQPVRLESTPSSGLSTAAFRGEDSVSMFVFDGQSIFTAAVSPLTNSDQVTSEDMLKMINTLKLPKFEILAKPSPSANTKGVTK